jgi:hypothetical protein
MRFFNFKIFLILSSSILFCSFGYSQQSLVFVYNTGNAISTTPYVKVDHLGKNVGSIGIGEYLTEFSAKGITSFDFTRQGLGTKTLKINIQEDKIFIKTIIQDGRWSVIQQNKSEVSSQILSLCNSLISKKLIDDEIVSTNNHVASYYESSGLPPVGLSSIVLMSNEIDACCNSSRDLILDMISLGLSEKYNLIDRTQLDAIIEEQKLQLSGLTNDDQAIEAGMIVGAQYSVITNCSCMDGAPAYSIKFINCETSEVSYSAIFQTESLSKIPSVLKLKLE